MRRLRFRGRAQAAALLVASVSVAAFLCAQNQANPDEVSARIRPYWPRPQYTLRTEARLVEVGVVVRDERDHAVGGLSKSDFEIRDSGKPREIKTFAINTSTPAATAPAETRSQVPGAPAPVARPRFVGLLFDDLNSEFPEFRGSQVAAGHFVKEGLAAGDLVAIFTTDRGQIIPFTADVPKLIAAIEGLRMRRRAADKGQCPEISAYDSYLIANNLDSESLQVKVDETRRCLGIPPGRGGSLSRTDPVVLQVMAQANVTWQQTRMISQNTLGTIRYIVDHMAAMPGNRMLLLASGGFYTRSLEPEQDDVIQRALRGAVVINSLDAKGLFVGEPVVMPRGGDVASIIRLESLSVRSKEATNDAMVYLAQSTGGHFFHNSNDLNGGYRELAALPEVTYVLGFTPDSTPDEKYHKLSVRLTSARGYAVQARPGYYASKDEASGWGAERRIDREVLSANQWNQVPVSISARPAKLDTGGTGLLAVLHADVAQLPFTLRGGAREQKLNFIVALLDEQGNFVMGTEGAIDFALEEDTYAKLAPNGLNTKLLLEAPPGRYRLRLIVEEAGRGRITTSTKPVEVQ